MKTLLTLMVAAFAFTASAAVFNAPFKYDTNKFRAIPADGGWRLVEKADSKAAPSGAVKANDSSKWIDSFTIAPVGAVQTADITGRSQYGAGFDVAVGVNPFVSIHVVNLAFEGPGQSVEEVKTKESFGSRTTGPNSWGGSAIDETDLLLKAKISKFSNETFSLFGIGGGLRDWNLDDWGFQAGLGVELSFSKQVSLSGEYSLQALFNHEKRSQILAKLNFTF